MGPRLTVLVTTHRVAPGLLSARAWDAVRSAPVLAASSAHPLIEPLRAAGVEVQVVPADAPEVLRRAPAVWLAAHDGADPIARGIATAVVGAEVEVEVLHGSWDLPGGRLLDVVATMDRLRSPGGCPWDAEQTHASLAPYLLEEAYEAYGAIEDGDLEELREELGDVLLQIAFHSRLAEEDAGWSIDDVAGDLVAKLVRRHPHVFADTVATTPEHVEANWEQIKAAEKGRGSVTEGVPMGQPALALVHKLQRRAAKGSLPTTLHDGSAETLPQEIASSAVRVAESLDPVDAVGDLLFHVVTLAREHDVDPEAALRGAARRYRDRLVELENDATG